MARPDVVIAGAGIVGLACALELERKGLRVAVLERGRAGREASWAAAGMLAARDPENPAELSALAERSIALYPAFLEHVAALSGVTAPFETEWVLEPAAGPEPVRLEEVESSLRSEHSLDPRKVSAALVAAVRASSVELLEDIAMVSVTATGVMTSVGALSSDIVLDCTGAWSAKALRPAKGQMLRVFAPGALRLEGRGNVVVRTPDIYLVLRLDGTVVIGATVEDAGFDKAVYADDLRDLRARAAALVRALGDAPQVESWAGLRPDTPDHLPLLGETAPRRFVAAGHYRNGILLAPGTAHMMAQMVCGEAVDVDLAAFRPERFTM